ncbi:hypothetical protein JL721_9068 [Aureococcus anophagefferens]|nr:hypothetical protein JL721_9068 [Aureococcus anophagefferens]
MQLSASIEAPAAQARVAGLAPAAPRGFLATVDGDDDVRVDADYCARLDASVRQLVDLDVVIGGSRALRPRPPGSRRASLKALKAAHEPRRTATSPRPGAREPRGSGSWTSNGADDGAADAPPPATLLAAGDRAAVHGLDCAGTLKPRSRRAHSDQRARDSVASARASLDAAASDAAAGVAKARASALLVAGAVGAGA